MKKHSNSSERTRDALRKKFKLIESVHVPPKGLENSILLKIAEKRRLASQFLLSGNHGIKYFLEEG